MSQLDEASGVHDPAVEGSRDTLVATVSGVPNQNLSTTELSHSDREKNNLLPYWKNGSFPQSPTYYKKADWESIVDCQLHVIPSGFRSDPWGPPHLVVYWQPQETFHKFVDLHVELRAQIWRFARREARTLRIDCDEWAPKGLHPLDTDHIRAGLSDITKTCEKWYALPEYEFFPPLDTLSVISRECRAVLRSSYKPISFNKPTLAGIWDEPSSYHVQSTLPLKYTLIDCERDTPVLEGDRLDIMDAYQLTVDIGRIQHVVFAPNQEAGG